MLLDTHIVFDQHRLGQESDSNDPANNQENQGRTTPRQPQNTASGKQEPEYLAYEPKSKLR
jgi:hypothetical protein